MNMQALTNQLRAKDPMTRARAASIMREEALKHRNAAIRDAATTHSVRELCTLTGLTKQAIYNILASDKTTPAEAGETTRRTTPQPERIHPTTGRPIVPAPTYRPTDVTGWTQEEIDDLLEADEREREAWNALGLNVLVGRNSKGLRELHIYDHEHDHEHDD